MKLIAFDGQNYILYFISCSKFVKTDLQLCPLYDYVNLLYILLYCLMLCLELKMYEIEFYLIIWI